MEKKGKSKRLLIILPLICVLIAAAAFVRGYLHRGDEGAEVTGYPVYVSGLYAADDTLLILRARDPVQIPREYDVYCMGEDGKEQYVRPYPGKAATWNESTEKLYFLDGMRLCAFEPVAGESRYSMLAQEYERICGAEGDRLFLQSELYGAVTMYSMLSNEEDVLEVSGWVLDVRDGYLFTWNVHNQNLTCYDYSAEQTVWTIDLSESFSSAPMLCKNGETLYLADRTGRTVYMIPELAKADEMRKTEITGQVIGMVDAGEVLIYATNDPQSISFYSFSQDGVQTKLIDWNEGNYYHQDSSFMMTVLGGRLYSTVESEEGLFSHDLNG